MVKKLVMLVAALGLSAAPASAQDARAVLQASLKAMGGENLKTIQYSGAGWSSQIGQTYGLDGDWPHFEVAGYTRVIDYDAKWSREDHVLSRSADARPGSPRDLFADVHDQPPAGAD